MSSSAALEYPLQVYSLEGVSGLGRLKSVWNRLADTNPLQRWEWADAWWQHFGPGRKLFTLVVTGHDETDVLGIVPLCREQHWLTGRVLRPLGTGEARSDQVTILALPGWEYPVSEAAAAWLANQAVQHWDRLELPRFETRLTTNRHFLSALEHRGIEVQRDSAAIRWRCALTPSWNAYLQWLPESTRRALRDAERRWLSTQRVQIEAAHHSPQLSSALCELFTHVRELRGEPLTPRRSIRFYDFASDVARRFDKRDLLRLWTLRVDGRTVGVWSGFGQGSTLSAFLAGVTPGEHAAEWQLLLYAHLFRQAIEAAFDYLDLGFLDEPTALAWRGEPRTIGDVLAIPPHSSAQWRKRCGEAFERVRHWCRLPR